MNKDLVLLDLTREGVAVITLNRPEVHNAFNPDVINRLSEIFDDLAKADHIRLVLIEGRGKSFSAGADLDWMRRAAGFTESENREDAEALARMLKQLRDLPQPTIALVHGPAVAGGVGLVAACDIAIAVRQSFFRLTEVRIGLIPAAISPYVIEAIGPRHARRYFLTAESFDADCALRLGLVHEVVDDTNALAAVVERISDAIFENAPGAITASKRLIETVAGEAADEDLVLETAALIAHQRQMPEAREGIAAFLEKRKPSYATRG
jgi:methylglutaconyl-CoA hydratase